MNKLFIMLPCFLLSRKLDGEDPETIYYVRIVYGIVQAVCILMVIYTYLQASLIGNAKDTKDKIIYIPPAPSPLPDASAPAGGGKTYTEAKFGAHVVATARSLLMSTVFGVIFTVGLHIYKGMVVGMAIQTIMGPFNLFDNALVFALFAGKGISAEDKIFEEKVLAELNDDDIIQDENGNTLERARKADGKKNNQISVSTNIEEVMLDVWDMGAKADIGKLMSVVTKENCNFQTKKDGWTPIMVLAGLGGNSSPDKDSNKSVKGTGSAIRQLRDELGANPGVIDNEGWNAFHWAAFHNNTDAAKELSKAKGDASVLLQVQDNDGNTPLRVATMEHNTTIAQIYADVLEASGLITGEKDDKKDEVDEPKKDK